ncbi:MAG: DUF1697 domain-containing protein [Gemmatimonadaceae bacterium]|nr:DUF1697 domain-containing protein [Gemmatimonadaceae bacterium]
MARYAAFLRGVSPMNAKMPELREAFEAAGFEDVSTVRSSGNVVFSVRRASEASLQRKAEAAIMRHLGRHFLTIIRPLDALREVLGLDPYAAFQLPPGSKRVVTFLRDAPNPFPLLPIQLHDASILCSKERDVFSAYVPDPKGPDFMTLLEKTFGKEITTRTWDTIAKVAR